MPNGGAEQSPVSALMLVAGFLAASALGLHESVRGAAGILSQLLIACLSIAMGVQNMVLARAGHRSHTTHITGPFTDLVADLTSRVVAPSVQPVDVTPVPVHFARVTGFAVGALSGAAAALALGASAPLFPAGVVAISSLLLQPASGDGPG